MACGTTWISPMWMNEMSGRSQRNVAGLVVWLTSILFSQKYWEFHHPNWLSYFSEGFKPPTSHTLKCWNHLEPDFLDEFPLEEPYGSLFLCLSCVFDVNSSVCCLAFWANLHHRIALRRRRLTVRWMENPMEDQNLWISPWVFSLYIQHGVARSRPGNLCWRSQSKAQMLPLEWQGGGGGEWQRAAQWAGKTMENPKKKTKKLPICDMPWSKLIICFTKIFLMLARKLVIMLTTPSQKFVAKIRISFGSKPWFEPCGLKFLIHEDSAVPDFGARWFMNIYDIYVNCEMKMMQWDAKGGNFTNT